MPGCAAIGCNNRSEKGYSMKCFPRDPQLRQVWKERVGRANWEPSKNSFLCHDHFAPDQWTHGELGKSRLKKDAIPSIFKETSTRKSPKKQRVANIAQDAKENLDNVVKVTTHEAVDNESEDNNYTLEYLEDYEYEISLAQKGYTAKNLQKQQQNLIKSDDKSLIRPASNIVDSVKKTVEDRKNKYDVAYRIISEKDMRGLEKENVIIVSDENNREIGKLIHNNESIIIVADENNQEIGQIVVENSLLGDGNLVEDIEKLDKITQNNYDEIEEKLKQICNGQDVSISLTNPRDMSEPPIVLDKEISCKNEPVTPEKTNNKPANLATELDIDKEIPRNMKIIFGNESGDENRLTSDACLPLKNSEHRVSDENCETAKIAVKAKENESLSLNDSCLNDGSLIEPSCKGETSNTPNIGKAMKRQKRTRENVMRSIEKAIAKLSKETLHNIENDQLTRLIRRITRTRKKVDRRHGNAVLHTYKRALGFIDDKFEPDRRNSSLKKSKFTIKVTGVADDVTKIMEGLENVSGHTALQIHNNAKSGLTKTPNERRAKYVMAEEINVRDLMRIDSRFNDKLERSIESLKYDEQQSSDSDSIGLIERCLIDDEMDEEYEKSNRKQTSVIETLFERNKEFIHTKEFDTKMHREKSSTEEKGRVKIELPDSDDEKNQIKRLKYFSRSQNPLRELRQKINAQQEVIRKLTDQLIIYKGVEAKLADLNLQLQVKTKEIQILKDKLQTKLDVSIEDESICKKAEDVKLKTISNLSKRLNELKETNKKLTQKIQTESQERKLLYHLKQKDDQIKELNWKLEKASKFLDRAEKNTNTYKRKMLTMQTSIRRQKASVEKQNHFKDLLIDNAKHEFSESALLTAMDIKNSCGIKCYQKLLSYDFPLPSLRTLRRRFHKGNVTEDDSGDEDQELILNVENQNDISQTEVCQSNETLRESEVTGTVQDIFEENNDTEDLDSNELSEDMFLQLKIDRTAEDT